MRRGDSDRGWLGLLRRPGHGASGHTAAPPRPPSIAATAENIAQVLRALYDFPKPVIAAVNGPAIAGGMMLATIPDFTLATPESKFGFNEVRLGFVPAMAASFLLRQVGEKRCRELLLTGRLMKAQEAHCLGLVTQLVAAEELMQTAQALAQTLLQNSPQAMQSVKRLLAQHARLRLDAELEDAIAVNAQQRSDRGLQGGRGGLHAEAQAGVAESKGASVRRKAVPTADPCRA